MNNRRLLIVFLAVSAAIAFPGFQRPEIPLPSDLDDPVSVSGGKVLALDDNGGEIEAQVADFMIDRYEVTNARYKEFVDATGRPGPLSWHRNEYPSGMGSMPVTAVTWDDAAAYCEWMSRRLPTAEEWQLAASGSRNRAYPWGDDYSPDSCYCDMPMAAKAMPVGSFKRDRSQCGARDMAGNVSEWTSSRATVNGLGWYEDKFLVVMGGSFRKPADNARCDSRQHMMPLTRSDDLGFRCAWSP